MKKILITLITVLIYIANVWSQVPDNYRYVKTWRLIDKFATVDSLKVDTAHINFQDMNYIDRFSIANSYNGNMGSPIQSKLYFDRPTNSNFLFSNAYFPYMFQIENNTFYNTKTPFSSLKYLTGGTNYREEDQIAFLFTANANKNLNFGTALDYIYARGEYDKQAVKRFAGSLFGSYKGKHYSSTGLIATNSISNQENGGITESIYLTNPPALYNSASDFPIRIGAAAQSTYKFLQVFYNQQYSIGFDRKIENASDTAATEFIPVTKFGHTIRYENKRKRYYESSVENDYYTNSYFPITQTNDTAGIESITNRFSLSLAEEFNKWMRFGLTAYAENEIENFTYAIDTTVNKQLKSNTKVGGILSKELGQKFTYRVLAEIDLLGYKAGDFLLEGKTGGYFKLWKDTIALRANGFISSNEPDYFLQNYQSNHFIWANDFTKTYKTHVGGKFAIPTRNFSLDVAVENITNLIHFDSLAMPTQYAGNVQVVSANFKQDFHFGKFSLENNVVYQLSSNQYVLPLPDLTLYHNFYFKDKWFDVLSVQFGANVRYHTAYYAPAYMPAIGQFYSQEEIKIGNYPVMNVYANFHLKRTRFFAEYYHVNQLFMSGVYYSMPNYPIDPAIFKMGLTWNFYD